MAFFRTGQQMFGMTPGIVRQADRFMLHPSLRYPIILRPKGEELFSTCLPLFLEVALENTATFLQGRGCGHR